MSCESRRHDPRVIAKIRTHHSRNIFLQEAGCIWSRLDLRKARNRFMSSPTSRRIAASHTNIFFFTSHLDVAIQCLMGKRVHGNPVEPCQSKRRDLGEVAWSHNANRSQGAHNKQRKQPEQREKQRRQSDATRTRRAEQNKERKRHSEQRRRETDQAKREQAK